MVTKRVRVLDIPIDDVTQSQAMERIAAAIASKLPNQITTVNPEFVMAALHEKPFKTVLQTAELNVADGIGIRAAAMYLRLPRPRWQLGTLIVGLLQGVYVGCCVLFRLSAINKPLRETVTGIDLTTQLSQAAAINGWRIYLIGGQPGVAKATATQLRADYPSIQIIAAEEGLTPNSTPAEEAALVDRVSRARPDILLVAFGAPKQDLFIAKHKHTLGVPVMMGVGGSFDFIIGRAQRSPIWLRQIGLEWLWRLFTQPWRLRRIATATVAFPWSVYRSAIDA